MTLFNPTDDAEDDIALPPLPRQGVPVPYEAQDSRVPLTRDQLRYRMRDDPDPRCQPGPDWVTDWAHAKIKKMSPEQLSKHYRHITMERAAKNHAELRGELGLPIRFTYKDGVTTYL